MPTKGMTCKSQGLLLKGIKPLLAVTKDGKSDLLQHEALNEGSDFNATQHKKRRGKP